MGSTKTDHPIVILRPVIFYNEFDYVLIETGTAFKS